MSTAAAPMDLDPFDPAFHEDPYPIYAALRGSLPVYRNERLDFYALSRHEDVAAAIRDHETWQSGQGTVLEMMGIDYQDALRERPMILFLDPPYHTKLRRLVQQAFTARTISGSEGYIRALANRLCDRFASGGSGDLVRDFAAPLPANVIFEMLGVPDDDRPMVREWIDRTLDRVPEPPHIPDHAIEAQFHQGAYLTRLLAEHKADPKDNLIGALLQAEIDDGDGPRRLSDGEILGFAGLLGGAGNETTTKLLSNTLLLLQRNPDARHAVLEDPSRIPDAVEESLRYWSPAHYNGRTATRDVTLHGVTIPQGARVLLFLAAANRDERVFPHADVYDIDRPGKQQHVAFGAGIHFCLGSSLARVEARIGLEVFLERFPGYRIDEDGLERVHSSNVQGFEHVPFVTA